MVRDIYEKPTANNIVIDEIKSFLPVIKYKTRMLILKVLESNLRRKNNKGNSKWKKKEVKTVNVCR